MTVSNSAEFGRINLDANATTRPFPEVIETVAHHMRLSDANPGSRHAEGRRARRVLEESREKVAHLLGADPDEVLFTSGGTEASNLAIQGFTQGLPAGIALTAGEHPATLETCRALALRGWKLNVLELDGEGRLRPDTFDALDWERLRLVSVLLAHNETGVIQDVSDLAARCLRFNVPLYLDAIQAAGKLPLDFHGLQCTAMSIGAHKFHGPRGIGALLVRSDARLEPIMFGGHQERGLRPGTESVALAAGMARALELCTSTLEERMARLTALRNQLEDGLLAECQPALINSGHANRLPNTLSIAFPGVDGEALLVALDLDGIACSMGSACASGSAEPAPVLLAMGFTPEHARSSLRFSLSDDNTAAQIAEAIRRIAKLVHRLRSTAAASS